MKTPLVILLVLCALVAGYTVSRYVGPREISIDEAFAPTAKPKISDSQYNQVQMNVALAAEERHSREVLQRESERDADRRHKETVHAINENTTWQIINSDPPK